MYNKYIIPANEIIKISLWHTIIIELLSFQFLMHAERFQKTFYRNWRNEAGIRNHIYNKSLRYCDRY